MKSTSLLGQFPLRYNYVTFLIIFLLSYLVGGLTTMSGMVSYMLQTVLIGLLLWIVLYKKYGSLIINIPFILLIGFLGFVFFSGIQGGKSISLIIIYSVNIIIPFGIYVLMQMMDLTEDQSKKIIKVLLGIAFLQLPVLVIQKLFYNEIVALSEAKFSFIDSGFGTFNVGNDHSMVFFLICLINYLLFSKTGIVKQKIVVISILSLLVLFSNSKISYLLLILSFLSYAIKDFSLKSLMRLFGIGVLLVAITSVMYFQVGVVKTNIDNILLQTITRSFELDESTKLIENSTATRLDLVLYYYYQPISIYGNGPYDFYNILTKEWKLSGNYSSVLWMYNDLGLIGLFALNSFYLLIYYFLIKNRKFFNYLFMFYIYSFFTLTYSDFSFNLTLFMFAFLHAKISSTNSPISRLA